MSWYLVLIMVYLCLKLYICPVRPTGFSMESLSKLLRSVSSYSGHHSIEEWVHIPMSQEQVASEVIVH